MLKNIAFLGKAGSGKTEAADFAAKLGYTKLSFATPLKDIASLIWGSDFDRVRLQGLGVAVRGLDENAWVRLAVQRIEEQDGPVVVDDCRFPNEYHVLAGMGFKFIRIEAPETTRVNRLQANGKWGGHDSLNHISETALDDTPASTLANDGDLLDFYEKVGTVLERLNT